MSYLGIDTGRALALAGVLRQTAAQVDPVQQLIQLGQNVAEITVEVALPLDEIEQGLRLLASAIEWATSEVVGFTLPDLTPGSEIVLPALATGPARAAPIRPDVQPVGSNPWNEVHQVASHNTYAVPGGIAALYASGIRGFELDIHRGAPTDLTPPPGPLSRVTPLLAIAVDHFDHEGGRPDDWRVYHITGSSETEYEYLRDGLAALAALPPTDPVTVFVDNKDSFGGTHTEQQLDRVVRDVLGERLFTPADLLARSPHSGTLAQAVVDQGWPTVAELQGKIFVVVTGELGAVASTKAATSLFAAPAPRFVTVDGQVRHVADASAVFYNANTQAVSADEIDALQATNSVLRTFFNPRCPSVSRGEHYRAVDVEPGLQPCEQ